MAIFSIFTTWTLIYSWSLDSTSWVGLLTHPIRGQQITPETLACEWRHEYICIVYMHVRNYSILSSTQHAIIFSQYAKTYRFSKLFHAAICKVKKEQMAAAKLLRSAGLYVLKVHFQFCSFKQLKNNCHIPFASIHIYNSFCDEECL